MKINEAGLRLIKDFEGLRLVAYRCPAGVLTIGFGHTIGVHEGDKITEEQANDFLLSDLVHAEKAVNNLCPPLNGNQFSALVSFVFNLGSMSLATSTLLRKIKEGKMDEAAENFGKWVFAGGKVVEGLKRRRKAERELFERPV